MQKYLQNLEPSEQRTICSGQSTISSHYFLNWEGVKNSCEVAVQRHNLKL